MSSLHISNSPTEHKTMHNVNNQFSNAQVWLIAGTFISLLLSLILVTTQITYAQYGEGAFGESTYSSQQSTDGDGADGGGTTDGDGTTGDGGGSATDGGGQSGEGEDSAGDSLADTGQALNTLSIAVFITVIIAAIVIIFIRPKKDAHKE